MDNETLYNLPKPLLGLGPMSKNIIDTIYQYSHENSKLILLIASRRQIETSKLGKGYVCNWTTEEFSSYLKSLKNTWNKSNVLVCRDHGGPWQGGAWEQKLDLKKAMENALTSYYADIDADFDLLHLDPSLGGGKEVSLELIIERVKDLLQKCHAYSSKKGKKMLYEIGTEEITGKTTEPENFEKFLKDIVDFCNSQNLPKPIFVVGQTQSLIREMRQIGKFNIPNTKKLLQICEKYGFLMKEHNADYLSDYQLHQRKELGIHSFNVAPEFGVIESKTFIDFCWKEKRQDIVKQFLDLSLASKRWDKWIIDERYISNYDKSLIAGHYVFATKEFQELREQLDIERLDRCIKKKLYERIDFYCS